jgi:hypothetical protein
MKPLGERQGFQMRPFLGEAATKDNLQTLLRAQAPGGRRRCSSPARTASSQDDAGQRDKQGAILCDEWPGGRVEPAHYFAATDVPYDAKVSGLIHFFFACYGGGCPQFDTYSRLPDGTPKPLAAAPMVARLPQKLLARGALAVVAHIDRAWSYSFQVGRGAPARQGEVDRLRDEHLPIPFGLKLDLTFAHCLAQLTAGRADPPARLGARLGREQCGAGKSPGSRATTRATTDARRSGGVAARGRHGCIAGARARRPGPLLDTTRRAAAGQPWRAAAANAASSRRSQLALLTASAKLASKLLAASWYAWRAPQPGSAAKASTKLPLM